MATGMRAANSIAEVDNKNDERYTELSNRIDKVFSGMEEVQPLLRERATEENSLRSANNGPQWNRNNTEVNGSGSTHLYATRISKVDFPKFDGKNVKEWLYRFEQFFHLDETP